MAERSNVTWMEDETKIRCARPVAVISEISEMCRNMQSQVLGTRL